MQVTYSKLNLEGDYRSYNSRQSNPNIRADIDDHNSRLRTNSEAGASRRHRPHKSAPATPRNVSPSSTLTRRAKAAPSAGGHYNTYRTASLYREMNGEYHDNQQREQYLQYPNAMDHQGNFFAWFFPRCTSSNSLHRIDFKQNCIF